MIYKFIIEIEAETLRRALPLATYFTQCAEDANESGDFAAHATVFVNEDGSPVLEATEE